MKPLMLTSGTVEDAKGETKGTLSLVLKDDYKGCGFIGYDAEFLNKIFKKLVATLEIGAWRVKPEYHLTEGKYLIRCRFFPGKPEDYKEAKNAC